MRVEVFSDTAVRLWQGWFWWKKYREAILNTTNFIYPTWIWADTGTRCAGIQETIDDAVSWWHWKQPGQIPTAIVVRKKEGK